jgi:hypothetical protein
LIFNPRPDGVDGSGVVPLVPTLFAVLVILGFVALVLRRPHPLVWLSCLVILALPLSPALTDLALRRALAVVPFLAVLGGVGAAELVRFFYALRKPAGIASGLVVATVIAWIGWTSIDGYFNKLIPSDTMRYTFVTDLRETAEFMDTLDDDAYVYWFFERTEFRYDVIRFIAPDVQGENRPAKWGGPETFIVDADDPMPVFVLMGMYRDLLPAIQQQYPGGQVVEGSQMGWPVNGPAFIAYIPLQETGSQVAQTP